MCWCPSPAHPGRQDAVRRSQAVQQAPTLVVERGFRRDRRRGQAGQAGQVTAAPRRRLQPVARLGHLAPTLHGPVRRVRQQRVLDGDVRHDEVPARAQAQQRKLIGRRAGRVTERIARLQTQHECSLLPAGRDRHRPALSVVMLPGSTRRSVFGSASRSSENTARLHQHSGRRFHATDVFVRSALPPSAPAARNRLSDISRRFTAVGRDLPSLRSHRVGARSWCRWGLGWHRSGVLFAKPTGASTSTPHGLPSARAVRIP
jgi:hypothetical protein